MSKAQLTLYIDSDLKALAKIRFPKELSSKFEEWLKLMLDQTDSIAIENPDKEIIRLQAEIQKIKSQAELNREKNDIEEQQKMIMDGMINNMKEYNEDLTNPDDNRTHGLVFLFKKKLNININPLKAKELLLDRIKESGSTV